MSLALRAVVAIALTVVFYVFAVAVMAGLIAFPILATHYLHAVDLMEVAHVR